MKRIGVCLMLLALLGAESANAQTVYKSIGPNGTVVYSDHPPSDGKIEKTFEFAPLPSSPVPDSPQYSKSTVKLPVAGSGVVLFSATWCGYCRQAKAYLARRGISYRNIDVDSPDGNAMFSSAGRGGIPLLVAGSRNVRGFSTDGYDAFFRH
jgi:glutaredoxin